MIWCNLEPNKPGFYWFRPAKKQKVLVMGVYEVAEEDGMLYVAVRGKRSANFFPLSFFAGEWSDVPVQVPEDRSENL